MTTRSRVIPPLQRAYAWFWLGTILVRLPWWIFTNIIPAQRPRRSWSLKKAVLRKFIRAWLKGVERSDMRLFSLPLADRTLDTNEGVNGVYVEAAPHLIAGKVKDWAEQAGVGAERVPGYWIHAEGSSIATEQEPDKDEKVVYFLHGGKYIFSSAHPSDHDTNAPRGLIEFCPSIKRSFNLEYRLASIPPEPTKGQFPCALIDAISGYNYLVDKLGFSPSQIILVGSSAGANLALALTRYLVEYKGTIPKLPDIPAALVLHSPWSDMSGSHWLPGSSLYTNAEHDTITLFRVPHAMDAPSAFIEPFGPDIASETPYISPACLYLEDVSFQGFPRTFINCGDVEVLLDQTRELYRRMRKSMGDEKVVYYEAKDAWHVYLDVFNEPERSETLEAMKQFIEQSR